MGKEYKLCVGIECHVQLKTKSKLFSGASNDDRNSPPNTLINHIDVGLPGALPVLNKAAVDLAIKAAYALNTKPAKYITFDRKHYFYPDLPMDYQITQYNQPIVVGGHVDISVGDIPKTVRITRAHLEADAGKSLHPVSKDYSLVDLNRAGTPLLEIVSEPDMHSKEEAKAYAQELWLLMRFAGVSDANLFFGNMRFDVNVSVSKTDKLGTRSEVKNLNSFRSVERAIEYEMTRQIELLERGQKVEQETRSWDDATAKTHSLRTKENADDYRYMPDPDLPPLILDQKYVDKIMQTMPLMPNEWRKRLGTKFLDESACNSLLEAEVEYDSTNLEYISNLPLDKTKPIANWIINVEIPARAQGLEVRLADADRFKLFEATLELINRDKLNSTSAKELISQLLARSVLPEDIEEYAKTNGLVQQSNADDLKQAVKQAIASSPKAAEDIKAGEMKAIGFLVGQVMKSLSNQANPTLIQKLLKEELGLVNK